MDPLILSLLFILGAASVDQVETPTRPQREEMIQKLLTSNLATLRASAISTSHPELARLLADPRVIAHIRALNSLTAHGRELNADATARRAIRSRSRLDQRREPLRLSAR